MLVDEEIGRLVDHYFGGPDLERPEQYHLGLHVGEDPPDPTDGSGFQEPVGDNYRRVVIGPLFWEPSSIPVTGPNQGRVVKHNAEVVAFPSPEGPWGIPTHVGVFTEENGGDPVAVAQMSVGDEEIEEGVVVRFRPGTLTLVVRRV